jgi:hypothetical protein
MKFLLSILFVALAVAPAIAQTDKEDKKEEKEEKRAQVKQKVDYNVFRRQILALKEYGDERRKIPELQKATKQPVKLVAYVDSTNDADDGKIVGYIRENVGDNSTDIYEVTYDRALKKIILVKPTGETVEIDKDEKATAKKGAGAKPTAKKQKEEGDEDEEPAPAKSKKNQRDTDDDDE